MFWGRGCVQDAPLGCTPLDAAPPPSGSYPEIFPLSALIACNAMNWPGGTAIYFWHKFHHWLILYTFGQYIVHMQWSITGDGFLTILKFGIRHHCSPEDTQSTGGRYASYWNAFLFCKLIPLLPEFCFFMICTNSNKSLGLITEKKLK